MIKLNFSELHENGFRINQLRLLNSLRFRGNKFTKMRKVLVDKKDLTAERNLMVEYLIENNEIDYTMYRLLKVLCIISLVVFVLMIVPQFDIVTKITPLVLAVLFWIWSIRKKTDFIMGNMGIDLAESIYNMEIKDKYNL